MSKDIPQSQDIEIDDSPDLLKPALLGGQAWSSDILQSQLAPLGVEDAVVQETLQILDMWNAVEYSICKLTSTERADLEAQFPGGLLQFSGFDFKNDKAHYLVSEILVANLPRFSLFRDRNRKTSDAVLERCRAMAALFSEMQANEGHPVLDGNKLSRLLAAGSA